MQGRPGGAARLPARLGCSARQASSCARRVSRSWGVQASSGGPPENEAGRREDRPGLAATTARRRGHGPSVDFGRLAGEHRGRRRAERCRHSEFGTLLCPRFIFGADRWRGLGGPCAAPISVVERPDTAKAQPECSAPPNNLRSSIRACAWTVFIISEGVVSALALTTVRWRSTASL